MRRRIGIALMGGLRWDLWVKEQEANFGLWVCKWFNMGRWDES